VLDCRQYPWVTALTIGDAEAAVVLRDVNPSDDVFEGGWFSVELNADGLNCVQNVLVQRGDSLGAFLMDLAESWRGWEGERTWRSLESHLAVSATTDGQGHNAITFTLRNSPTWSWTASLTILVDAGEEMTRVASDARALLAPLR
jgi:hypothetical protein